MPQLNANSGAKLLSAIRSELGIQKKTTIEVAIETETRLLSNSVIHLHLSTLLFDVISSTHMNCAIDGISTLCTLTQ